MSIRARDENVIYANFGKNTRVDPEPKPKRRVHSQTLQESMIRDIYYDLADEQRISRGKAYAANGNVVSVNVQRDRVVAEVAGSQLEPFRVDIVFPHRGTEEIGTITTGLLSSPGMLKAVREGRIPAAMLSVLLAESSADVRLMCDCPDRVTCCKHSVAVLEAFAEKVLAKPALLFELRGLGFAQLELAMQAEAKNVATEQLSSNETFWDGAVLPALPTPKTSPAIDDADLSLLHKAMRSVSYTSIDELRAVSDLEDLYDFLTRDE